MSQVIDHILAEYIEVIAWVHSRDHDEVKKCMEIFSDMSMWYPGYSYQRFVDEFFPVRFDPEFLDPQLETRSALRAGKITATGVPYGIETRTAIRPVDWTDLRVCVDGSNSSRLGLGAHAVPRRCQCEEPAGVFYTDLLFDMGMVKSAFIPFGGVMPTIKAFVTDPLNEEEARRRLGEANILKKDICKELAKMFEERGYGTANVESVLAMRREYRASDRR